ncbi:MAG: glycosidase [Phycisphaerae bacterium]|nr:glycosidase [Phycisphaerae bacterium]
MVIREDDSSGRTDDDDGEGSRGSEVQTVSGSPNDGKSELLKRNDMNPILWAGDWPYPINTVFNAAATRLPNGETLLLARVEDRRGISHLCAARSKDGVTDWRVDPEPTLMPDPKNHPEEAWGIEDARIVWLDELHAYAVTYTSYSRGGPGVSLALTQDFRTFERRGVAMTPLDKDASLFPRRFDGRWAMIHRPDATHLGTHIWVSFSPDLKHWGDHTLVIEARRGAWWDANKIGLSTPPIETDEGWLLIYHGVRQTPANSLYRLGLALLDKANPLKCLLRSDEWIFGPEAPYERLGDVPDVVFPCGHTVADDGDTINVYYGAADTAIALATGSIQAMLTWLRAHGRPGDVPLDDV